MTSKNDTFGLEKTFRGNSRLAIRAAVGQMVRKLSGKAFVNRQKAALVTGIYFHPQFHFWCFDLCGIDGPMPCHMCYLQADHNPAWDRAFGVNATPELPNR